MKKQKSNISRNLSTLRQLHKYSQEDVAAQIGVSRQAVAKWEAGESVPDILNCDALAKLYDVELDDLIHYDQEQTGESIPPRVSTYLERFGWENAARLYFPSRPEMYSKLNPAIYWLYWAMNQLNIRALL